MRDAQDQTTEFWISLIHQANYLLDRLKKQLEQEFVQHGGVSERMTQARLQYRTNPITAKAIEPILA